jgi:hypothetical protein
MIKNRLIALGNLYYWLITNFICWIYWYPHDVIGFTRCYVLAIPFYFTALMKTWVYIRVVEIIIKLLTDTKKDDIIWAFNSQEISK